MFRAINARTWFRSSFHKELIINSKLRFNSLAEYTDVAIREIEEINLPIFSTKFRHKNSPFYWKLKDAAYEPILSLYGNNEKEKKNAMITIKSRGVADIMATLSYPLTVSETRMLTLNRLYCWAFLQDDCVCTDTSGEGMLNLLDLCDVIRGSRLPDKPIEILAHQVLNEMRALYTPQQMQRFVESLYTFPGDHLKEIENQYNEIKSFDEMLSMRLNAAGPPWAVDAIPFSLGVDVTEFEENHNVKRLKSLAIDLSVLVNDFYTMKKEVARREIQKPYITLLYLYSETKSLNRAVNRAMKLLEDFENEFLALKSAFLNDFPHSKDLHAYVDGCEHWCAGNLIWSLFTPRYNYYGNKYPLDLLLKRTYNYPNLIPVIEENIKECVTLNLLVNY